MTLTKIIHVKQLGRTTTITCLIVKYFVAAMSISIAVVYYCRQYLLPIYDWYNNTSYISCFAILQRILLEATSNLANLKISMKPLPTPKVIMPVPIRILTVMPVTISLKWDRHRLPVLFVARTSPLGRKEAVTIAQLFCSRYNCML